MNAKRFFLVVTAMLLVGLLVTFAPVAASPNPQVFYQTPTADADGRIFYVVREGDSCTTIYLLTGVPIETLRELNNLGADCNVIAGQKLLLGVIQEASPTPGPSPTPTPILPTPTPFNGNGRICILLFEDTNGDGIPTGAEAQIAGGAVSVTDLEGETNLEGVTAAGEDPLCFEDIAEGKYNVSVAPPEGYNATTLMNYALDLRAGDQSTLDFGAQPSSAVLPAETEEPQGRSPLLAIIGGVLVLGGAALGVYYVLRLRRM